MSLRGKNPKSLANLKPAKKGEIRNPYGINKKRSITDEYWETSQGEIPLALIRRFNRKCHATLLKPGVTWAEAISIRAAFESVMEGSVRATREIREAIEGKAPPRVELTTPPKQEVRLVVRFEKKKNVQLHCCSDPGTF